MMQTAEISLNPAMVNKIQNFLNDPAYREAIESASSYNARLAAERTMRLPFLDSQTGVAQNHSTLWMDARQRLPGQCGQVYTYPSKRWRKKRRQYLNNFMQPRYPVSLRPKDSDAESDAHAITTVENTGFNSIPTSGPSVHNEDSKDSSTSVKEEASKQLSMKFEKEAWYYDDLDMPDAGEFDELDADSDYDYEESYSKRKKKRGTPKSPRGGATSSRNNNKRKITYDPITDAEKPFACDLCGARYKTRPGLTYHYTHSHKDKEDDDEEDIMIPSSPKRGDDSASGRRHSRGAPASSLPPPVLHPQQQLGPMQLPPTLTPQAPPPPMHMGGPPMSLGGPSPPSPGVSGSSMMPPPSSMMHQHHPPPPHLVPQQPPSQHHMSGGSSQQGQGGGNGSSPQPSNGRSGHGSPSVDESQQDAGGKRPLDNMKARVQPSTYCDFCLGDAAQNKKSGEPEELVSCSDCGRSGHPSCLQFTPNMIISVKKYRWQCIECKCCSICGLSDNDDQLLFCDDCDRGYHMYCLSPPLDSPPEGSWSCTLCLAEFHNK